MSIHLASAAYIAAFSALLKTELPAPDGKAKLPVVGALPERVPGKKLALILSPHPDDECLSGGLPLRLQHEEGWQIINIVVTLGSDAARKQERLQELANACKVLGFDLLLPAADGFGRVSPETRDQSEKLWAGMVEKLVGILQHYKPDALFMPNIRDGHRVHIGTYYLGMDALNQMPPEFTCVLAQTEYWHPNAVPNSMIGLTHRDVSVLLTALCCHVGEVARNPYHQKFPAYLSDNVRRGSERIGGRDAVAAFDFGMLYQVDVWANKRIRAVPDGHITAPDDKIKLPQ